MIKFREKNFFWGAALTVGGIGLTGAQMMSESSHNKEREEEAERQEKLLEDQNNLIRKQNAKIAKLDKSQQAAVQGIKAFAAVGGAWNALKGVGSAAKTAFGKDAITNVKMAAGMAGAGYVANKWIQHDMKKSNLDVDADTGQLVQKQYGVGSIAGKVAMPAMIAAPAVIGYYADKKQAKDQMNATGQQPTQGQYSRPATLKGIKEKQFGFLGMTWKGLTGMEKAVAMQNKGRAASGVLSNIASFGLMGPNNTAKFASELAGKGGKLEQAGKWMQNHQTLTNLGAAGVGVGATKLTWDAVQSGTEKGLEKLDPNAYKYQNAKNQQVG